MPICPYAHIGMNGFPEVPFLGHISRSKAQTEQLIGEWHRRDRGSSRRPPTQTGRRADRVRSDAHHEQQEAGVIGRNRWCRIAGG